MGGGAMTAAAMRAAAKGVRRGITPEHLPRRVGSSQLKPVASDKIIGGGDEAMVSAANPLPTVVFGGAPTLREAKEATSELAVALEKAYLSSASDENAVAPPVPANAIMAFRLLHKSPAVQDIVASIACDPNVWDALLHNQELQEYLHSQSSECSNVYQASEETKEDNPNPRYWERIKIGLVNMMRSFSSEETKQDNPDRGYREKIKIVLANMMRSFSHFFRNSFGDRGGTDTTMASSLLGLAVMVIIVIAFKRV